MTKWLLQLIEFLDLDRSSVGTFRPDGTLELAHFAALPGIEPATEGASPSRIAPKGSLYRGHAGPKSAT